MAEGKGTTFRGSWWIIWKRESYTINREGGWGGGTTIRILREKEGVSGTNREGHYRLNTLVIFVMALIKTAMGSVNRPGMTPVTVCNNLDPVSPVSLRFSLKEHV